MATKYKYEFYCRNCDLYFSKMFEWGKAPKIYAPYIEHHCGGKAFLVRNKMFRVGAFKPYVEDGFDGKPRLITSAKQRDELCKKHSLTYDKTTDFRKKDPPPAVDDIDWGDVKQALETGRTPDGEKVEEPMSKKEAAKILEGELDD